MNNGVESLPVSTKLSDVPDSKQTYVPKSTYWHRVVEAEFGKSKSADLPMFTLTVEIVDHPGFPDPKTREIVDVNGIQTTMWLSLTEKARKNLKRFFEGCGLPTDISLEDLLKNPNPQFLIGQKFLAMGYSKLSPQIDEITNQPIIDPATNQPVVFYQYSVGQVLRKVK